MERALLLKYALKTIFPKRNKGIFPLVNVLTLCEYDRIRANDRGKVLIEKQLLVSGKQHILRINSKSSCLGGSLIGGMLTVCHKSVDALDARLSVIGFRG